MELRVQQISHILYFSLSTYLIHDTLRKKEMLGIHHSCMAKLHHFHEILFTEEITSLKVDHL